MKTCLALEFLWLLSKFKNILEKGTNLHNNLFSQKEYNEQLCYFNLNKKFFWNTLMVSQWKMGCHKRNMLKFCITMEVK